MAYQSARNPHKLEELLECLSNTSSTSIKREYSEYFYDYLNRHFLGKGTYSPKHFKSWLETHCWILHEIGGRGKSVLEVGCGPGFSSLGFYYAGAGRVVGIDNHVGSIKGFRQLLRCVSESTDGTVIPIHGNILKNKFADGEFDILILNEVISHINFSSVESLGWEFFRLLSEGGALYVKDSNNKVNHWINPWALGGIKPYRFRSKKYLQANGR